MPESKATAQQKGQYATELRLPQRAEHLQKRSADAEGDNTLDMPEDQELRRRHAGLGWLGVL